MQTSSERNTRRYDFDWLRIFAFLTVFFFHSLHFFDIDDWSVKNHTTYAWICGLMNFIAVWMMPLFFLISGASVFYASCKNNARKFIRDKVSRLLVPLLAGVFSFSIMQVYLERVSHGQFEGPFLAFIPHYFKGIYLPGSTGNFAFHGMHLWYLLLLFIFTLVLLPLFWWFKRRNGSNFLRKIGDILALPGALIIVLIPTVILQNLTNHGALAVGGWRIVQYPWFLVAGYLVSSHEKLQQQIIKTRWVWVGLIVVLIALSIVRHEAPGTHQDVLVWPGLFVILGFGMEYLQFSNKFLVYSTEAVMPFYILHQNILLLLGFFIVGWDVPDPAKFLIITISTFLMIIALYEYLIRRYNFLRILFGMRAIKNTSSQR